MESHTQHTQPGFSNPCDVGHSSSLPVFQNFHLESSALSTFNNWATPTSSRPCKDVLRQAIRVSRIKKGQVMPIIEKSSTVPKKRRKPLVGEIPEEMAARRQKNREAAKKSRLKRRQVLDTLHEKIDTYKDRNKKLEQDIQHHRDELAMLESHLSNHDCRKNVTIQHEQSLAKASPPTTSTRAPQHEAPTETTAEDIVNSLDDLLSDF